MGIAHSIVCSSRTRIIQPSLHIETDATYACSVAFNARVCAFLRLWFAHCNTEHIDSRHRGAAITFKLKLQRDRHTHKGAPSRTDQ